MAILFEDFKSKSKVIGARKTMKELFLKEIDNDEDKILIYEVVKNLSDDDPIFVFLYLTSRSNNNYERHIFNHGVLLTEIKNQFENDFGLVADAVESLQKDVEKIGKEINARKRSQIQKHNNVLLRDIKQRLLRPNSYEYSKLIYWHIWGVYGLLFLIIVANLNSL